MQELHENEQYFFDVSTSKSIANALERFRCPCLLGVPKVALELAARGKRASLLDVDERFSNVPGFLHWDIYRPVHVALEFDAIFCDPPFFNVGLAQLFVAIRLLAKYQYEMPVAICYLRRRQHAILATFNRFGLEPAGYLPRYVTVDTTDRSSVEVFANFRFETA